MRISVLGLILMFLFPITLFAQQRVDVTGKTLVVSNNGEGQEVLPYTNILVLEAGDSTLVKGVMSDAGGNFRLSFHAKKESVRSGGHGSHKGGGTGGRHYRHQCRCLPDSRRLELGRAGKKDTGLGI